MRVAIFVFGPATLTLDGAATLTRYVSTGAHTEQRVQAGPVALEQGIFQLFSVKPLAVTGDVNCEFSLSLNEGKDWPDPTIITDRVSAAFPEITPAKLEAFFSIPAPDSAPTLRVSSTTSLAHVAQRTVTHPRVTPGRRESRVVRP